MCEGLNHGMCWGGGGEMGDGGRRDGGGEVGQGTIYR